MAALVLLSEHSMKKTHNKKHPLKESEIPVDLATMRVFRSEMVGKFDGLSLRMDSFDKRMESFEARMDSFEKRMDAFDKRMDAFDKKLDSVLIAFKSFTETIIAMLHEHKLLLEEQNLRNKQAYDGYLIAYQEVHEIKRRIKPECLID